MPNPHRAEVPIRLKGKDYLLRFTHDAIAKIEDELGLQATQFLTLSITFPKVSVYRKLLVLGLQHKWTKIQIADVAPDEDEETIQEWQERVQKALNRAFSLAFTGKEPKEPPTDGEPDGEGDSASATGDEKGAEGDDGKPPDAPGPTA